MIKEKDFVTDEGYCDKNKLKLENWNARNFHRNSQLEKYFPLS